MTDTDDITNSVFLDINGLLTSMLHDMYQIYLDGNMCYFLEGFNKDVQTSFLQKTITNNEMMKETEETRHDKNMTKETSRSHFNEKK